jgi:crotonobetainyl-CoA:carnitine CoA-transferase CaiB-like acyl-CoA transferase
MTRPFGTTGLADLGADMIEIEDPAGRPSGAVR